MKCGHRWVDYVKINLIELEYESVDWIDQA
jgi:hypothetical protein